MFELNYNEQNAQENLPFYARPVEQKPFSAEPELKQDDEVIELDESFEIEDFQVVRREFFANICEPSITFSGCRFYVNSACLRKFPNADFVQVLVNRNTKMLALKPCSDSDRDSFAWCSYSKGKRKPKQTTCKIFYAKMVSLMNWTMDYRYRMLGKLIHANGEYLLAFDLTSAETFEKAKMVDGRPVAARTPVFNPAWQDQFGIPYSEHKKSLQINVFDGYAVLAIKDEKKPKRQETVEETAEETAEETGPAAAMPMMLPESMSMPEEASLEEQPMPEPSTMSGFQTQNYGMGEETYYE